MRVAAGRPATLRWQLTDEGGTGLTPDTGHNPTVTVTAGDGVTALYTAQATTLNQNDGAWEWVMPPQTQLDTLAAVWTTVVGGVTYTNTDTIDVIAQRLAEPYLLRQDSDLQALTNQQLLQLLDQVEELIRDVIGYCPVLEGARPSWDTLRGTLNDALYVAGTVNGLPYGWGAGKMFIPGVKFPQPTVYAGTINGVALDPTNDIPKLQVMDGCLVWSDYRPWISGRYSFWLTHGEPNPPQDLRWCCQKLIHHFVQKSNYPDRAYSIQTEGASILFSMPNADRPTGLPEVDAILARYRLSSVI